MRAIATALALAASLTTAAWADDTKAYGGISLTTPGEFSLRTGPTTSLSNANNPTSLKLYGGLKLVDGWAVELGYGAFGSFHFIDPSLGSKDKGRIAVRALTLAARHSWALNDSFTLFGKLGLAYNRFSYSDTLGQSERASFAKPMWGMGVELKLGSDWSVPLEFEYMGKANTKFGRIQQEKLEIGLRRSL